MAAHRAAIEETELFDGRCDQEPLTELLGILATSRQVEPAEGVPVEVSPLTVDQVESVSSETPAKQQGDVLAQAPGGAVDTALGHGPQGQAGDDGPVAPVRHNQVDGNDADLEELAPTTKAEQVPRAKVHRPIPVARLPQSDSELIDQLHLSLGRWRTGMHAAVVLPVDLPQDPEAPVRVLVDAEGRLGVLAASIAGGWRDISSVATAVREWLEGQLARLTSDWPQVRIDQSLAVGMILVTAGATDDVRQTAERGEAQPVQVMQLYLLANELGSSLLIV